VGNDFKDLFGEWRPEDDGKRSSEGFLPESETRPNRALQEKEVRVVNVFEATTENANGIATSSQIFVLLRDNQGRKIRIFVVRDVAYAIQLALENQKPERPFTHDLIKNLLDKLGVTVDRVIIDDLWHETFYAKIALTRINNETLEIDARPSDAIALALRFRAPIYAAEAVLEAAQDES
jgi:bifunctional DNase/RNase